MIKSAETIRLEVVQEKIEQMNATINSIDMQLSFVQGDELCEVASDSVSREIKQIKYNLHDIGQWVENALITMTEIDAEAEERRLRRAEA